MDDGHLARFTGQVTALAEKLATEGIEPGDRVAIMSSTRYEWVLCDFAIWTAGAVTVPIYETSAAEQVAWILADSGTVAAFVADEECRRLVEPHVSPVWTMTGLDTLEPSAGAAEELRTRRRGMTADSPATIVYTSGTTGRPKGCVLSHANLCAEVRAVTTADGSASRCSPPSNITGPRPARRAVMASRAAGVALTRGVPDMAQNSPSGLLL